MNIARSRMLWSSGLALAFVIGYQLGGRPQAPASHTVTTAPQSILPEPAPSPQLSHQFLEKNPSQAAVIALTDDYLAETDPVKASALFASLLGALNKTNASEVAEKIKRHSYWNNALYNQLDTVLESWARHDGEAAMRFLGDNLSDVTPRRMVAVVAGWVVSDASAATAWVESLPLERSLDQIHRAHLSGMAKQDAAAATRWLLNHAEEIDARVEANLEHYDGPGLPSELSSQDLMTAIVQQQKTRGHAVATAWAETLPNHDLKSFAFGGIVSGFGVTHRDELVEWIEKWAGEPYTALAANYMVGYFPEADLPETSTWANSLDEPARSGALPNAIWRWARQDPTAASDFLSEIPASETRDIAAWRFVDGAVDDQRQLAISWAESIQSDHIRQNALRKVARVWSHQSPDTIGDWLPNSGLSEEAQAKIIESLK